MLKREHLPHALGAATLALMFSAVSVYPQTTTGTSGTGSAAGASSSTAPDARTPGQTSGAAGSSTSSTPSSPSSGASGSTSGSTSSSPATTSGSSSDKAATAKSGASGASGSLAKADQQVLRDMAISNLSEIEAAKIAQSKSQDDKVKSYAQRMIDEHTKAQGELEQLAQSKGVDLPKEPDAKHKAMAKKLSALDGEKFDKQYMAQGGVKDHRDTHNKLQKAAKNVKDPEVKALVAKMTPVVQDHLQSAQQATGSKGGSAKSASGKADAASGSSGGAASSASGSGGASTTGGAGSGSGNK